jgi:hypothetical protein
MDRTTVAERVLWRIAVGCAALLLCAPMTPRTSWTFLAQSESGPGGGMTHSAGWDWIAPLLGIVALVSLIVGRRRRLGVVASVLSTMVASISLAASAAAALGHWLDLRSGSLSVARSVIHPAPAVAYFAAIAIVGTVAALVLLGSWLHQDDAESQPLRHPLSCPLRTPRWACSAGRAAVRRGRDYRPCASAPPGRICCAPRSTVNPMVPFMEIRRT